MTYTETKGHAPFDWWAALENPPSDPIGRRELERRADRWPMCACGNLCDAIPRDCIGEPKDDRLYELGLDFGGAIDDGNWENAKTTLRAIESRAAELLAEMGKETP